MEVIAKTRLEVTPHTEEFEYQFAWKRKRGVDKDYWFTPTGKCKIYLGALYINKVGTIEETEWKELVKQLKKNKCDTFIWGSTFYTTTSDNTISEVGKMGYILGQARDEWEERKYIEFWVEDDREFKI